VHLLSATTSSGCGTPLAGPQLQGKYALRGVHVCSAVCYPWVPGLVYDGERTQAQHCSQRKGIATISLILQLPCLMLQCARVAH